MRFPACFLGARFHPKAVLPLRTYCTLFRNPCTNRSQPAAAISWPTFGPSFSRQTIRPLYFCFSSLSRVTNEKHFAAETLEKMASEVPQTTSLDPVAIPVNGCRAAISVAVTLSGANSESLQMGTIERADLLLFLLYQPEEDETETSGTDDAETPQPGLEFPTALVEVDKRLAGETLSDLVEVSKYKAKLKSSKYVRLPRNSKVRSLGIVGLGTAEKSAPRHGLVIAKEIVNVANEQKSATLQLVFPAGISANVVQSILESLFISLSPHVAFFSDEAKRLSQEIVTNISLILPVALRRNSQEIVDTARIYARGVYFAQELVNAPPNYCNTVSLANAAVTLAKDFGLTYRILDQKDAEKEGMGAYLGVAKGSMFPPKFIHLTYEGKGTITDTMAFVGKGIVFDSGGYNIKSMASLMDFMKIDMGGAAAVLGAAYCIGLLKPEGHRIHFIVAAAENMVSSSAYRPGDIITASNGTTIQVLNTDAEGRLTLADALLYARKLGAETIIDLATLTGACMVALGSKVGGLYSNNRNLAYQILDCAESKGELLHELPLVPEYDESLDSNIADVNNIDKTGYGGSITAALFLQRFIKKSTHWAHIDMAGPAFLLESNLGTGFGVRTLVEYSTPKNSSRR